MDETDRGLSRLHWQCRRGMLELDLVLVAFLDQHCSSLTQDEIAKFAELLSLPDNELWDRIVASGESDDARFAGILRKVREVDAMPLPFVAASRR